MAARKNFKSRRNTAVSPTREQPYEHVLIDTPAMSWLYLNHPSAQDVFEEVAALEEANGEPLAITIIITKREAP